MAKISAQGSVIEIETAISSAVYAAVGQVVSFDGLDGERPDVDVSDLASTAREYILGLKDNGNMGLEVMRDDDDVGQAHIQTMLGEDQARSLRITLSNNDTYTIDCLAKSFTLAGGVDDTVRGTVNFKLTGDVTIVTA